MHTTAFELARKQVFDQIYLPIFAKHEIAAWQAEEMRLALLKEKRKVARKSPSLRAIPHKDANEYLWSLDSVDLNNRLVGDSEHELDTQTCPTQAKFNDPTEGQVLTETWSDAAVEELHETVLHYSLAVLKARGNSQEKKEVLQWIFAPETYVVPTTGQDGQIVEVYLPQEITPFSFEQCCRICGYNSERLVGELEPILKKLGIHRL